MEPKGVLSRGLPAAFCAWLMVATSAPDTALAASPAVPPPTPARLTLVLTTFDTYNRAGLIDSQQVAASLRDKITRAQQLLTGTAIDGPAQAQQSLQAFVDELGGEANNHVVKSAADTMTALAEGAQPPTQFTVAPSTTTSTTVATAVNTATTSGGTTTTTTNPVVLTLPPATNVTSVTVTAPASGTPLPAPPPGGQTLVATSIVATYSGGSTLSGTATVTSSFTPPPGVNPLSAAIYTLDAGGNTQKLTSTVTKNSDGTYTVTAQTSHFTPFVAMASPPTVTSVSPVYGPQAGGTSVSINGAGFTGATSVLFNNVSATTFTADATNPDSHITATAPPGTAGPAIDVQVVTPSGTSSATAADHFTYYAPVAASASFSPTTVYTGNTVTLSASATGGYPPGTYTWLWTFDDATTSTAQNPQRTFNNAGTFTETLKATDSINNSATATTSVTVVLPTISGTVTANSQPAPGVTVTVYSCAQVPGDGCSSLTQVGTPATTDAGGNYSVAVPNGGSYRVQFAQTATLVGQWYGGGYRAGRSTNVAVNGAPVTGVNATLQPGHQVSGTVTNASNAGLGGVFVGAAFNTPTCCSPGPTTQTSSTGAYALTVADGSYNLNFNPPPGYLNQGRQLTMSGADQPSTNVTLVAGDIISGHVSYSGAPLGDVFVQAFDGTGHNVAGAGTDQNGLYQVTVPTGTPAGYDLLFQPDATTNAAPQWFNGVSTVGQATSVLHPSTANDITLPTGFHIKGTVLGAGNAPLQGIPVGAFDPATATRCCFGPTNNVQTDANGNFSLTVPAGSWLVQFDGPQLQKYVRQWWQNSPGPNGATAITVSATTGDVTGINVTLQPGFYVSGTVTGTNSAPLQGIHVNAFAPGCCQFVAGAQTDAGGNYQLLVPAGSYVIAFNQDEQQGYLPLYSGNTLTQNTATPITVSTDVTGQNAALLPGFPITGTVFGTGNALLGGINVNVNQPNVAGGGFNTGTRTAADGTYTLLVPAGTFVVQFNGDQQQGYLQQFWNNALAPDQATSITITNAGQSAVNATLQPGFPISGVITASNGQPAAGAGVQAQQPGCGKGCGFGSFAQADAQGHYSLLVPNGTYIVGANPCAGKGCGGAPANTWYVQTVDPAQATTVTINGAGTTVNLTLLATYSVTGTVTAAGTSQPLPNANVGISLPNPDGSCCGDGLGGTPTDANGAYSFGLPNGTYYISVFPPPSYVQTQAKITVAGGAVTQNFAVQPGYTVSGTVSAGGKPVGGGLGMFFANANPDGSCCATGGFGGGTQPDGSYSVTVPNGTYWANFSAPPGFVSQNVKVVVSGANQALSVSEAAGFTISGTVTAAGPNTPLANVNVSFSRANPDGSCCVNNPNSNFGAQTDGSGSYTVTVPQPGATYYAFFGPTSSYAQNQTTVTVTGNMTGVNASLRPGYPVTGTVTDATTHAPIANVNVNLSLPNAGGGCCGQFAGGAQTGANGSYSVIVAGGTYLITFGPPAGYLAPQPQKLTVTAAGATQNAALQPGMVLTGTVVDSSGAPVQGVNVMAFQPNQCCAQQAPTDATGKYSLTVPAGVWHLGFVPSAGTPLAAQFYDGSATGTALPSKSAAINVNTTPLTFNATLQAGLTITGKVTDASGSPLAGMTVTGQDPANIDTCCYPALAFAQSDATGAYTMVVPSGSSYLVEFNGDSTHVGQTYKGVYDSRLATLVAGGSTGINAALALGYTISGVVTGAGNAPLAGLNVGICVANPNLDGCISGFGGSTTQADGSYSIFVPNGSYELFLSAPGYPQVKALVTINGAGQTLNENLQPGFSITGRVVDGGGNPVSGVAVQIFPSGGGCCIQGTGTDANGNYSVPATNGSWEVWFLPPVSTGLAPQFFTGVTDPTKATAVTVNNANVGTINATLRPGVTVSGTVTDSANHGVGAIYVFANVDGLPCCQPALGRAQTHVDGSWTMILPAGTYDLGFSPPVEPTGYMAANGPGPVSVASAPVTVPNVALQTAYELSGQVTDATTHAGVQGVQVGVMPNVGTTTQTGGYYGVMVPAGSASSITFTPPSGSTYKPATTAPITFGGPTTVNQTLGP